MVAFGIPRSRAIGLGKNKACVQSMKTNAFLCKSHILPSQISMGLTESSSSWLSEENFRRPLHLPCNILTPPFQIAAGGEGYPSKSLQGEGDGGRPWPLSSSHTTIEGGGGAADHLGGGRGRRSSWRRCTSPVVRFPSWLHHVDLHLPNHGAMLPFPLLQPKRNQANGVAVKEGSES